MADPRDTVNTHVVTRFLDESGRLIAELQYEEKATEDENGLTVLKQGDNIILSSGEAYNPGMSVGPRGLKVGWCQACHDSRPTWPWQQKPQVHGLTSMGHLKHCQDCGTAVCPRHSRKSRYDRKWRCLQCHSTHRRQMIIQSLFFEEGDQ